MNDFVEAVMITFQMTLGEFKVKLKEKCLVSISSKQTLILFC